MLILYIHNNFFRISFFYAGFFLRIFHIFILVFLRFFFVTFLKISFFLFKKNTKFEKSMRWWCTQGKKKVMVKIIYDNFRWSINLSSKKHKCIDFESCMIGIDFKSFTCHLRYKISCVTKMKKNVFYDFWRCSGTLMSYNLRWWCVTCFFFFIKCAWWYKNAIVMRNGTLSE